MRPMAGHPDSRKAVGVEPDAASVDPSKSLVMASIGQLVSNGQAEWTLGCAGKVELRLMTGEVFLLDDDAVTRIA
jgi:hypothetical protein